MKHQSQLQSSFLMFWGKTMHFIGFYTRGRFFFWYIKKPFFNFFFFLRESSKHQIFPESVNWRNFWRVKVFIIGILHGSVDFVVQVITVLIQRWNVCHVELTLEYILSMAVACIALWTLILCRDCSLFHL